jgi:hypothetical protein
LELFESSTLTFQPFSGRSFLVRLYNWDERGEVIGRGKAIPAGFSRFFLILQEEEKRKGLKFKKKCFDVFS